MKNKIIAEKIDNEWATRRTWFLVRDSIYHADRAKNDIDREWRLKEQTCLGCYYLTSGLAGSGFTEYTCGICNRSEQYHNTAVPKFCRPCAMQHEICRRCGADMQEIKDIPTPDSE